MARSSTAADGPRGDVIRPCSFCSVTSITFGLIPHALPTRVTIWAVERDDPPVTAAHMASAPRLLIEYRPLRRQLLFVHVDTWLSRNACTWLIVIDPPL